MKDKQNQTVDHAFTIQNSPQFGSYILCRYFMSSLCLTLGGGELWTPWIPHTLRYAPGHTVLCSRAKCVRRITAKLKLIVEHDSIMIPYLLEFWTSKNLPTMGHHFI
jgi:hypothetical protein